MDDQIETHELIRGLTCEWKTIGNTCAFVNREMIAKTDWQTNLTLINNQPKIISDISSPINVTSSLIDTHNAVLTHHVHRFLDNDAQFLGCENEGRAQQMPDLSETDIRVLDHLLTHLITLNEQLDNYLVYCPNSSYDHDMNRVIDYMVAHRNECLNFQLKSVSEKNQVSGS
jgi:hypothetical protein